MVPVLVPVLTNWGSHRFAVATHQKFLQHLGHSIAALYRDFGAYPQPIRDHLRDSLREYTRNTIDEDWPLQRQGIVPHGGTDRIMELSGLLFAFEPTTSSQQIIDTEALRQLNRVVEMRRSRLANVTLRLPPVLWWVVAFGALLNTILIWLQDMEIHVHLMLGGVLASILALVILFDSGAQQSASRRSERLAGFFALVYRVFMKPGATAAQPGPK